MAPGGNYCLAKELLTLPHVHLHHFKEMLCIAELLPAGDIPKPSNELALQWHYILYQKSDREKFMLSRKTLDDETIESVMAFFRLSLNRKKLDVTIERQEVTSVSFAKLWRSSADVSTRPLTSGAASTPDARLLFATIDDATLPTKEIGAIVVVLTMTAVATTTALPTEH